MNIVFALKDEIILTLQSTHHHNIPSSFLPSTLTQFLADTTVSTTQRKGRQINSMSALARRPVNLSGKGAGDASHCAFRHVPCIIEIPVRGYFTQLHDLSRLTQTRTLCFRNHIQQPHASTSHSMCIESGGDTVTITFTSLKGQLLPSSNEANSSPNV